MVKISSPSIFTGYCALNGRRLIGIFLLLALVSASLPAWAYPSQQPAWKQNMKAGVELGFGVPYGWLASEEDNKKLNIEGRQVNIKVNAHWRVGVVGGYGFPFLDDTLAIGLDVGLFLGNKRKFEVSYEHGKKLALLEAQYLHVPFALKLVTFDKETGVQEGGLTLGYELNILLSSKCSLSGRNNQALDQLESIAKSSKLGGSIFLGGKIDLVAGCYLMGQFKFPITDFLGFKDAHQNSDDAKIFLHGMRIMDASFVELGLGFNIMKWL
jgi:hypothetical protein